MDISSSLPENFPKDWQGIADKLTARNVTLGFVIPDGEPKPIRISVAGGYVRPIFGLSERKCDLPQLLEFHEPQIPLNWAVGLAMFSLTNEEKVRSGDWQEATIRDLEDRVFCLTERDAPRRWEFS